MSFAMRNFSISTPRPITWAVSSFIARLKRIDEGLGFKLDSGRRNSPAQLLQGPGIEPGNQPFQQMPLPWTFLTSGYFIGFLIFVRSVSSEYRPVLAQSAS